MSSLAPLMPSGQGVKKRLAQIGYGRWGRTVAAAVDRSDSCELVALHQRTPLDNEPRYVGSLDELLSRADLDGCIIASPLAGRSELIERAIERRLPILVEKPLSASAADSERLARLARLSGVPVLVDYVHSFSPSIDRLVDEIESRRHGELRALSIFFGQPGLRYTAEGVETLLYAHLLAIAARLIELDDYAASLRLDHASRDDNRQLLSLATTGRVRNRHRAALFGDSQRGIDSIALSLTADLAHPLRERRIVATMEHSTLYCELSDPGRFLYSAIVSSGEGRVESHGEEISQSDTLGCVFRQFSHIIDVFKLNQFDDANLAAAVAIDRQMEQLAARIEERGV